MKIYRARYVLNKDWKDDSLISFLILNKKKRESIQKQTMVTLKKMVG